MKYPKKHSEKNSRLFLYFLGNYP